MLDMNVVGWIVVGLPRRRDLGRARRRQDRARLPAEHRRRHPRRSHRRLAGDADGLQRHPGLHRRGRRRRLRVARHPPRPQRDQRPLTGRATRPRDPIGQRPSVAAGYPCGHDRRADARTRARTRPASRASSPARPRSGYVDGERGRLLYRGYRIGDLVERGTYPAVANLLWTGEWDPAHRLPTAPVPGAGPDRPARPAARRPSRWTRSGRRSRPGARRQDLPWPPTVEQARALTSFSPSALAAFARLRAGRGAGRARPLARPRRGVPLPAHGRAARTPPPPGRSTPTSSSAPSTASTPRRSRPGSSPRPDRTSRRRSSAAIGTLKGPLHGGAPSEVVDQLNQIGSAERCRGMGPRRARPRRAADGLRPSRLPRLRPAGRRAAQGRRGDAEPAGLAAAGDRGRGRRRCASSPRSTRSARSRPTSSTTRRPSSWASA